MNYVSKIYITPQIVFDNIPNFQTTTDEEWCEAWFAYVKANSGCHYFDENEELHRDDGPALELPNGLKRWFYHGYPLPYVKSQNEYECAIRLKAFW